ncbi:MAG: FecR family protein [Candidatus Omnitrophota bacterium]|jgi:ferric-dicitrate binding protein FerR (iron transport regulator)
MKKIFFMAAVAAIIGVSLMSATLTPQVFAAKETERTAKVTFVQGDVKVQKSGATAWDTAKAGLVLADGDTIKTAKASAVEISFDKNNKNMVRLEEESTAILRGKSLNRIELPVGRIRSLVKSLKKESSFDIKTPTVVAGARGSGWDVIASDKRDNVKAFEDEIFVQSYDQQGKLIKEIFVREGWEVLVDRFQSPGELIELTDKDRNDWSSWRDDLSGRLEPGNTGGQDGSPSQFNGIQDIQGRLDEQEDFKDQVLETEDIRKVEDRVENDNRLDQKPSEPCNSPGLVCP